MSNACEEVDAEIRHLFLHIHMLLKFEVASPLAVKHYRDGCYGSDIDNPCPNGVVPWLAYSKLECSLLAPFIAIHGPYMENICTRAKV